MILDQFKVYSKKYIPKYILYWILNFTLFNCILTFLFSCFQVQQMQLKETDLFDISDVKIYLKFR